LAGVNVVSVIAASHLPNDSGVDLGVDEYAAGDQGGQQAESVHAGLFRHRHLCLDEVGYLTLDPRGAELLFQIITAREERASIAGASNAPFSEWGNTFTDPRLAAAVVDRLTFHAHIIQTGTSSHRLTSTRTKKGAANT
jgi:DNA replication protein DnaC